MSKQISILGTGWLGRPLAKALLKEKYIIKGSTTSQEKLDPLKNEGIDSYLTELTQNGPTAAIDSFLAKSEILIINIPPGLRRNPESNFVGKIEHLIPHIEKSSVQKILFIGSTSVFAEHEDFSVITSETVPNATSNAGKQLIETEQILRDNQNFETTILRFAGLFDTRRHPATMLSKRKNIKNPLAPVNLIHLDDSISIIKKIIVKNSWNQVFNAASPKHPTKAEYYTWASKKMKLPLPHYDYETTSIGKIIDSNTIRLHIEYDFMRNLNF